MLPWASTTVKVQAGSFKQALVIVSSAMAKTPKAAPYLQGILCKLHHNELRLFGTDGKRLARVILPITSGGSRAFFLPAAYIELLLHPLGQAPSSSLVTVSLTTDKMKFQGDTVSLEIPQGKPEPGELPQLLETYELIFQQQAPPLTLSVSHEQLLSRLRSLNRVGIPDSFGQIRLKLTVEDREMELRLTTPEASVEHLPIQRVGQQSETTLNLQFLLEALEAVPAQNGVIQLGVGGPTTPLRIQGERYTYLLLPIAG